MFVLQTDHIFYGFTHIEKLLNYYKLEVSDSQTFLVFTQRPTWIYYIGE